RDRHPLELLEGDGDRGLEDGARGAQARAQHEDELRAARPALDEGRREALDPAPLLRLEAPAERPGSRKIGGAHALAARAGPGQVRPEALVADLAGHAHRTVVARGRLRVASLQAADERAEERLEGRALRLEILGVAAHRRAGREALEGRVAQPALDRAR